VVEVVEGVEADEVEKVVEASSREKENRTQTQMVSVRIGITVQMNTPTSVKPTGLT